MTRLRRAARLAYLLAQHPTHRYAQRVRRGLELDWLDAFLPYWKMIRPPGLPITDYASFQAVRYHFAAKFREANPEGDQWNNPDQKYSRLLSYIWRRAMHPLRWLPSAWHLRDCKTVLEYGAGAAPYACGVDSAWPLNQRIAVADIPGPLQDYCAWRFRGHPRILVMGLDPAHAMSPDGIVCTEVFEHLPDPVKVADWMTRSARVIAFDYVLDMEPIARVRRADTLTVFAMTGRVSGPDARGLYVWRKK